MAVIMIEGFDKYKTVAGALFGSDWNTVISNSVFDGYTGSFAPGAFFGDSFKCGQNSGLYKSLPGTYKTLIWGCRFFQPGPSLDAFCVTLGDGTTNQWTVRTTDGGFFSVCRGSEGGGRFGLQGSTTLQTSTANISINTWHYLEAKVTIGTSDGAWDVYLDDTLIMTMTGQNTQVSGNAYTSSFQFHAIDQQGGTLVDDLYIFDTTGSFCNDIVGDSVVETQFPISDSTVQFSVGAATFGDVYQFGGTSFTGANNLWLRPYTPAADCTINSVGVKPAQTNLLAKYKMCIYADTGGNAPGALMSDGTEIVGTVTNAQLVGNLTSPQSLIGGTQYWIGFLTDTNVVFNDATSTGTKGFVAASTYTSGVPPTAPMMTGNQADLILYGIVTTTTNYTEVNQLPFAVPLVNYLTNTSVGDQDLYGFPALSLDPLHVWAVKVSAFTAKSDAGARTISLLTKSGATQDEGDSPDQSATLSYQYYHSQWGNDPDTGLAWDFVGVNNATSGVKVKT